MSKTKLPKWTGRDIAIVIGCLVLLALSVCVLFSTAFDVLEGAGPEAQAMAGLVCAFLIGAALLALVRRVRRRYFS